MAKIFVLIVMNFSVSFFFSFSKVRPAAKTIVEVAEKGKLRRMTKRGLGEYSKENIF